MKLIQHRALLVCHISLILGGLALVTLLGMSARPAFAESPAFVRIVHASPDVGTADIFLDGTKLLSNFQFGTVTDYVTLPPGPHKVQVALIGRGAGAAVITQILSVNPGVVYTVAALGTKSTGLSLKVFIDDNLISMNMTKVRIYHLSPGIGSINVSAGVNTVISALAYTQASSYISFPAGSYTFAVTATQPGVTIPISVTLQRNMVTSIFAVGVFNGTPNLQLVSTEVPGIPGLPPTGSDPNPDVAPWNSQPPTPGLLAALASIVIGVSVATRRLMLTRQKANVRSHK